MGNRINNKKINYVKLITIVVALFVCYLSIGYSALQITLEVNDIEAYYDHQEDIRITNIAYKSSSNGGLNNTEFYRSDSIYGTLDLPNINSSVTYTLSITNYGNIEMGIANIISSDLDLDYEITGYNMGTKLCNSSNQCTLNSVSTFDITIKYKEGSSVSGSGIAFDFEFVFAPTHNITYMNISNISDFPTSIVDDGTLNVTFKTDIPYDFKITDSNNVQIFNYTYVVDPNNNSYKILSIPNVNDDLVIDRYYSITYVLNGGINSINNPDYYTISSPVSLVDPTKTNYIFDGWYTNNTYTGNRITSTSSLSGDSVLYAKWVIEIDYVLAGGTQNPNQILYFMEGVSESILPATRKYYSFDGWHDRSNNVVTSTNQLSITNKELTANWSLMMEKTTLNGDIFTANNINGSVNLSNLGASNNTYTYSGVNKTGGVISTIRVNLTYNKQTGKTESITCDAYRNYSTYQSDNNHSQYLGTVTQNVSQGANTTTFDIVLSGNNQIQDGDSFIVLFSNVQPNKGTFSTITIEFNPQ